jgi:lipopolysaccharide transport system ATP-binding protein
MCSDIAIDVESISKRFQIYDKPRDRLLQMITRGRKQYFREFLAVRDVTFRVERGETVGIVGRNGSGKSTLLQLICGTLNPSAGNVRTWGRVAALLELGSGFNPEFTGRENVYMNAAVLGLSKAETDARFSEIEAFAEINEFIDQPVKTYSSGMMVRLAFAVAINVDPQILIVDEALSVGDERFQRKCFARIEAIKAKGATILFVSHSGNTVIELCDRAILMDAGEKLAEGLPNQIVSQYQKLLYAPADKAAAVRDEIRKGILEEQLKVASPRSLSEIPVLVKMDEHLDLEEYFDPHLKSKSVVSYVSHGARISEPHIVNLKNEPVNCLRRGDSYKYRYTVDFDRSATALRFGMMIKTLAGVEIAGSTSATRIQDAVPHIAESAKIQVEFKFNCHLNPGAYFLNAGVIGIVDENETYLHRLIDGCLIKVLPMSANTATGIVDFSCKVNLTDLV